MTDLSRGKWTFSAADPADDTGAMLPSTGLSEDFECSESAPPTPPGRPRGFDRAVFAITALLGFLVAAAPVTTNDLFWHVKTGEYLWATGGFHAHDVFSYTASELDWHLHEWLTQLLLFGLHQVGGLMSLRLFTGLMAVVILWQVWRLANRELNHGPAALLVLLVFAVLATNRFQTRPTLFSMLFFLGAVTAFSGHRGRFTLGRSALVVAGTLVWVNLHSVGLLAIPLYAAFATGAIARDRQTRGAQRPQWLLHGSTLLAASAVTLLNPSGWHLYEFALQDKGEVMNYVVDEWGAFQPFGPNPALSVEGYCIILATIGLFLATYLLTGVALNREPDRLRSAAMPDPVRTHLLLLCLCGGLLAVRFHWMVAIALLFTLQHLAVLLQAGHFRGLRPVRRLRRTAAVAAVILFALHYHRDLRFEDTPIHGHLAGADYYRREIAPSLDLPGIRFLAESGLTGNAFCHYGSGGMLSYWLFPKVRVFIDSRADLYRRDLVLQFLAVRDGHPDQQEILDRHRTDIYYRHWDIAPLRDPSGWTKVYAGPDGDIWLRKHDRNLGNLVRCKTWHRRQGTVTPSTPATPAIPR